MVNPTFWKTCACISQRPEIKKGGRVIRARETIGDGNRNRNPTEVKKGKK